MVINMRKKLLEQIDCLQEEHCLVCEHIQGLNGDERDYVHQAICGQCTIGKRIRNIGEMLSCGNEPVHHWTKDETYYAVNHIDVLGLVRGVRKVADKLALNDIHVEMHYFKQKKKRITPKRYNTPTQVNYTKYIFVIKG
jgi:hypothetical protein